ncbi:hypothetical protein N7452_010410 [Penicillium brevicompactum]|uniref:Uncharacterized protein n=1 Tax=Penicillium brevicompactum TaxID=5074 RepID=A0A9W9UDA1_PENBR|nr:hypothetical protein N7452_010410 [Penicillium brevicompactum]
MERNGRHEESKVWDSLLELIRSKPDVMFWQDMALHEIGTKGKRGREVRIVMPHEAEDEDGSSEDEDEEYSEEESLPIVQKRPDLQDSNTGPRKVQATSSSFSHSRNGSMELNEQTNSQTNSSAGVAETMNGRSNPFFKGEDEESKAMVYQRAPTSSLAHRQHPQLPDPQAPNPRAPIKRDPFSPLSNSLSNSPLKFTKMSESIEQGIQARIDRHRFPTTGSRSENSSPARLQMVQRQVLAIVSLSVQDVDHYNDLFKLRGKPAMDDLRTWLEDKVFRPSIETPEPGVMDPNLPQTLPMKDSNGVITHRVLGDRLGLGLTKRLLNFHDPQVLGEGMRSLTVLYSYAKVYASSVAEMSDLCREIAQKLQIAWNCYRGLEQCQYLIELAQVAFRPQYSISNSLDEVQGWLITFIAETTQLFAHACPGELNNFLRSRPMLYQEILDLKKEMCVRQPELFMDLRILLRSRGISDL